MKSGFKINFWHDARLIILRLTIMIFRYSLKLMEEFAQKMDQEEINTVYCFGDNPLSDIYGANLFTETLEKVNAPES